MMFELLFSLFLHCSDPLACDVVVICPQACDEAVRPWVQFRESQGHKICLLRPTDADTLRTTIRSLATQGEAEHVVIIGDAPDSQTPNDAPLGPFESPTCYVKAEVNVKFGSEPWIASDNPFADIDEDGLPDLSIGRIAIDSEEELKTVLGKVMNYERNPPHTPWKRKINLIAGVGGFGAVADSLLEMSTKRFIVDGIPPSYEATMTYGSWQSPYCPAPPSFRDQTINRLNDGCLMWIYIGHGMPGYVAPVQTPLRYYPVLDVNDVPKLQAREGLPIAIFFACYTAAFDKNQPGDCLAEEMLTHPQGPVAVLGATRISMPYAMAVMSNAMLDEFFVNRCPTLGELLMRSKRTSMAESDAEQDRNRAMLDALAASFSPTRTLLDRERLENASLFNLVGDPLMRLQYPSELSLESPDSIRQGETIEVRGEAEWSGDVTVEVSYRRDRTLKAYPKRRDYTGRLEQMQEFAQTYGEANERRVATKTIPVEPGSFSVELEVPSWAKGAAYIRAYLESEQGFAMSGKEVRIKR